jgi:ketosteroid isomerase-like protein
VYQLLVKRHLRKQFARLSTGDYESVLRGVDDSVHHRFAGQHPLGGERHTKQALRLWFQRLFRLYTSLVFEVHRITLTGWPWDLRAAAEWSATVTPARGDSYLNRGVHIIRIRRGRVTELHAYEDSQAVAQACRAMADLGVTEGEASPIES